jgi:DNA polymerase III epsilon subunit-like protein
VLPGLGRFGLDRVCEHLGIRNGARHRAAGDATATAELLVTLLAQARTSHGLDTLGDLMHLLHSPPARRVAR